MRVLRYVRERGRLTDGLVLAGPVLAAVALFVLGWRREPDGFVGQVWSEAAVALVAIAVAVAIYLVERSAERRSEERRDKESIARLVRAGLAEATRVLEMAQQITEGTDPSELPVRFVDHVAGYWVELLGERFFALTGESGPLEALSEAHLALRSAVDSFTEANGETGTGEPRLSDVEQRRLNAKAVAHARQAISSADSRFEG